MRSCSRNAAIQAVSFWRFELALNQIQHLPQNGLGVAGDTYVNRPIAANFGRIDIHLNGLGVGIKARRLTVRDHVVETGGEEENDVGLAEGQRTGAEKTARVVFGHHAAALRGGEERDAGLVDELLHLGGSVGPDDAGAADDQRPLRPRQHVDGLSHLTGVTHAAVVRLGGRRPHHVVFIDAAVKNVAGEIEVRRPHPAVHGLAIGDVDVFGHALWADSLPGPLARRTHHAELIDFLKRLAVKVVDGAGAAERDHRCGVGEGVRQAGQQVGGGGARSGGAYPGFAGDARIGVGHHRRGLFVAHVDHLHAKLAAAVLGAQHRATHDEKHRVGAFVLQGASDEFVSVYLSHVTLLDA